MDEDLITTKAAAAILNVSWQLQQLAVEGKLEVVAAASGQGRVLFRRTDVEMLRVERGVGRYGKVPRERTRELLDVLTRSEADRADREA